MTQGIESAPVAPRRVLLLLTSARREGNAEGLARRAIRALPRDTDCEWLDLNDIVLPPFRDRRHDAFPEPYDYPIPRGAEGDLLRATLDATDIVVVAPLYWYSMPASAKLYLDYWSSWLRIPAMDFRTRMKGKSLRVISVLSDEDRGAANPLIETFRRTADYMQMRWDGVLLGFGNRPGDVEQDVRALDAATHFLVETPTRRTGEGVIWY